MGHSGRKGALLARPRAAESVKAAASRALCMQASARWPGMAGLPRWGPLAGLPPLTATSLFWPMDILIAAGIVTLGSPRG
jgi:hypothetical protein